MELKRQKQAQIEKARQTALDDNTITLSEVKKSHKIPTCVPIFQDSQLIRALRPGTAAENIGYRKALHFQDDQYLKAEKDPHDQIMRFYQDYEENKASNDDQEDT